MVRKAKNDLNIIMLEHYSADGNARTVAIVCHICKILDGNKIWQFNCYRGR